MTTTPAKLRKACDKVGGVYAMAKLFVKGHPPQYLYRRVNRKVAISEMDALACDAVPSAPMGGARNRERKAYASNHCGVKRDH